MTQGEADAAAPPRYHLRLFVAGTTQRSLRTINSLRRICDTRLGGQVDVEVIDIYQQPELAQLDAVVAAPTLVKLSPLPVRRIIGDLSDEARVLRGLGLALDDTLP